ncbi:SpoIIE family protein phosphatase [candidate division KSB1 bacterium]|nr:SpoIIE family protein phosphatase [candidate division KSB1 bacterium]
MSEMALKSVQEPFITMEEIQKLKEKVRRLESLIEVSAIISSELDLKKLLKLVMEKAQKVMDAEASSIILLNENTGKLEWEVALGEVGEAVQQKAVLEPGQGIGGWVVSTGKPLNVSDVRNDPRFYAHTDEITGFKTRSILAVPLMVKEKVIGVAEVLNPVGRTMFDNDDLDLFTTFSRQVALAIENAKMYRLQLERQKLEQQLEVANSIQQSFMPQHFPTSSEKRFAVWAKNIPARTIGGDFFDFIEFANEQKLGVIIGDVSGKGIPAALYMARLVSDFRFFAQSNNSPAACFTTINNSLVRRSRRGFFVTAIYLLLDVTTGMLTITNGGHLPPLWYQQQAEKVSWLKKSVDIPLGISSNIDFNSFQVQLNHGDSIVLFTDGIIEAKNRAGEQFNWEGLEQCFQKRWDHPRQLIQNILEEIKIFSSGTPQHDDMTILALTWW